MDDADTECGAGEIKDNSPFLYFNDDSFYKWTPTHSPLLSDLLE